GAGGEVEGGIRHHHREEEANVRLTECRSERRQRHATNDHREDRCSERNREQPAREFHRNRSKRASRSSALPEPSPSHSPAPRTTATGSRAVLPMTSSAAAATSSATAITVDVSSRPYGSRQPR